MTENINLWNADLHLHTNLSLCAPKDTTIRSYLDFCGSEKVDTIGISNHIYLPEMLASNGQPESNGLEHALKLLPEIQELRKTSGVNILFGCEAETFLDQGLSLAPEDGRYFDYVLLAPSHINNFPLYYAKYDITSPDSLREIIVERFLYACSLDYGVPTAICHPLYPIVSGCEEEVVNGISDSVLADCFSAAAKSGKSIEIHACLYRKNTTLDDEGLSPTYLRVLSAAKACGCKFHFGTDAHRPSSFIGKHALLHRAAERVGITQADMWKIV